jgi:glycosyltransferase involved in cell wall biosynthesis
MEADRLSIVVGCTSKAWGGNEKWALDAASALLSRGHAVSVFWSHAAVGDELRGRSTGSPGSTLISSASCTAASRPRPSTRPRASTPFAPSRRRPWLGASFLLPGHSDHVREILAGVDAYVLSSRYEGMANTLLEAMSVGAPIVATDVSGAREVVRDGVDGLVVPPEDPSALRDAILMVLRERALAERLGASARARARERFSGERMADGLEEAFAAGRRARSTRREDRWRP